MRIRNLVFFAPGCKFSELDFEDKEALLSNFKSRIERYYFSSIAELNNMYSAYCAGILCFCLIDALANLTYGPGVHVGDRFKRWVREYLTPFFPRFEDEDILNKMYLDFRCGLVHEGMIKRCGQFTYQIRKVLIHVPEDEELILVINPRILGKFIRKAFNRYMVSLKSEDVAYQEFKGNIERIFSSDVDLAKRIGKKLGRSSFTAAFANFFGRLVY